METPGLYANRNSHRDFVKNAIERETRSPCNVYIAVAFFTEANVIDDLVGKGCKVRLIVRLGFPTSPHAIEQLMLSPNVEIRYFTDHSFHPKLYIFGDKTALVGSANLTGKAILTNQEIVVSIGPEDDRFCELAHLFADYWDQAKVMTAEALADYKAIFQKFDRLQDEARKLDAEVLKKLGTVVAGNIARDKVKQTKTSIFLEDFQKTYQESVSAFDVLRSVYEESGYRKAPQEAIPLRLEIDSFISHVRDHHAQKDSWKSSPLRVGEDQRSFIRGFIEDWKTARYDHFEETIVHTNYPRLMRVFSSPESVKSSGDDELFNALATLHSFHDRFRFYPRGIPTWKKEFLAANNPARLRDTLSYVVFGKGNIVERMANAIFNSEYKLNQFGQSNVQELIGWCNKEELPVINGRTTKILRFFGSDVRQLQ